MIPLAFVTGGTGLAGSHLLYELLRKGYRVRALKRPNSNTLQVLKTFRYYSADAENLFQQIEWTDAGLLEFDSMAEAMDGCSRAYHAAAIVSFHAADRSDMLTTNVKGTANIVNVCLEKQIPLCHVSSIGALGRNEQGKPVTENDLWQTSRERSDYACSKYKSEMEVWRGISEGLQAVIVNPSIILGPGNWEKGSSSFFPKIYRGMRFYSSGTTGFVDVRDVSRCMILLMEQECFGERYILSSKNMSYRELFDMIAENMHTGKPDIEAKPWMLYTACRLAWLGAKIAGKKPVLTKETAHSAMQHLRYSNEKISNLPYEFIPIEQTIRDCCCHFLHNR
jgi:nucleoside-diphosphate-sugar epimerase